MLRLSEIIPICFSNTTISPPCHFSISFILVVKDIAVFLKYIFKFFTLLKSIRLSIVSMLYNILFLITLYIYRKRKKIYLKY